MAQDELPGPGRAVERDGSHGPRAHATDLHEHPLAVLGVPHPLAGLEPGLDTRAAGLLPGPARQIHGPVDRSIRTPFFRTTPGRRAVLGLRLLRLERQAIRPKHLEASRADGFVVVNVLGELVGRSLGRGGEGVEDGPGP